MHGPVFGGLARQGRTVGGAAHFAAVRATVAPLGWAGSGLGLSLAFRACPIASLGPASNSSPDFRPATSKTASGRQASCSFVPTGRVSDFDGHRGINAQELANAEVFTALPSPPCPVSSTEMRWARGHHFLKLKESLIFKGRVGCPSGIGTTEGWDPSKSDTAVRPLL